MNTFTFTDEELNLMLYAMQGICERVESGGEVMTLAKFEVLKPLSDKLTRPKKCLEPLPDLSHYPKEK